MRRKVNSRRARLSEARCFGAEAVAIRSMRCLVAVAADETGQPHQQLLEHGWLPCLGITQATHVLYTADAGAFDEDNIQFGCAQELAVQFEGHYMRYKALAYALCEEAGWPS